MILLKIARFLIQALKNLGEQGILALLNKLGGAIGNQTRALAYRLYVIRE
jgi:hypothetical protein